MKIRTISIKNFRSIYELDIELGDLVVFIGANNSGKTTIIHAIRSVFENINKFKEQTVIHIPIQRFPHEIREKINALWFFENFTEPAIIYAKIDFETDEIKEVKEASGFKEVTGGILEIRLEKIERDEIMLKLDKLSLLGYATTSSKKADEILKTLGRNFKGNHTEYKIVEDTHILDESLFNRVLLAIGDKVHYVNMYENISRPTYEIEIPAPQPVIPQNLITSLQNVVRETRKRMKFRGYSNKITESTYHPSLEKEYEGVYFRYDFYGGGDQVVDSLIAIILDKGQGHVFLLEEPEIHLHPSYVKRLGELLEELIKNEKVQIIMVSHSPMLIRYLSDVEKSLCIVRKSYIRNSFGSLLPSTKVLRLSDIGKIPPKLVVKRDLFFSDLLILVEGASDEIIINKCIKVLGHQLEKLPHLNIGYIHYAERKLDKLLDLVGEIAELMDIPKFLIADNDRRGKEYIQKALEKNFKEEEEAFKLGFEDIFFTVKEEILSKAIRHVLGKIKEKVGNDKITKVIESLPPDYKVENKRKLNSIFSKIEDREPRWEIILALTIAKEIKKPEDLKSSIKNILYSIDKCIKEREMRI